MATATLKVYDGDEWIALSNVATAVFKTIACPSGTNPVADDPEDTLTLTSANAHFTITGDGGSDTVDFAVVTGTSGAVLVLANAANTWSANQLLSGTTALNFKDTDYSIGQFAGGLLKYDALVQHRFDIGGAFFMSVGADVVLFEQNGGLNNITFDFSTDAELDIQVDSGSTFKFTADDFYPTTTDVTDNGKAANRWDRTYGQVCNFSHATNPDAEVGNIWFNETTKTHRMEADDGIHNIVGAEALTTADETVVNDSTEYVFADTKDIAADSLVVGSAYEWIARGKLATDATINFTFRFKLDNVIIVTPGAISQVSGSGGWFLKGEFTVRSIGATGTVQGNGDVGTPRGGSIPFSTPGPATVDTTQTLTASFGVQMSVAGAFKSVTLQQFIIKKIS